MKKLLFPVVILVSLYSCQKENISSFPQEFANSIEEPNGPPAPKIDVCHYDSVNASWHLINININAWHAHERHGDIRLDDQDQDGYFPNNECGFGPMGDCDDLVSEINPGMEEQCENGIDDNCDGATDEGCSRFCYPNEVEVLVNTGSESYTIYVYPFDNAHISRWSPTIGYIGATEPWDGQSNTETIIDAFGNGIYAASICDRLSFLSGCEWYLPSLGELRAIESQLGPDGDGSIPNGIYWSSTESNANNAIVLNFLSGGGGAHGKLFSAKCRCVRK